MMNVRAYVRLSFVLFSFLPTHSWAQTTDYYTLSTPGSGKAYWLLKATPVAQTPTVQFYDAHHHLLYQEPLPTGNRQVDKPTKQALDKLLANLVSHRLLTTTYLANYPEATSPFRLDHVSTASQELRHTVFRKGIAVLSIEPSLSAVGKLLVSCAQLSTRLLMITLEDTDHNELFEQRFKTSLHRGVLNLTQLPTGVYFLRAGTQSRSFTYRLLVDQSNLHYVLQNKEVTNNL